MAVITKVFYSNAGGHGRITNLNANWATLRALTTGASASNQGLLFASSAGDYYLYRCFLPFSTQTIPSTATIISWSMSIYRDDTIYALNNDDTTSLEIIPSTEVDPTSLSTNDFDNVTFSSKGTKTLASTSNGAYNTITGTDTSVITKVGYTKLALTTGRDLNNQAPTGDNTFAYQAVGAANPPYLTVTYRVPYGDPMLFGGGVAVA